MKIPINDNNVKLKRNDQLMFIVNASPKKKPDNDFKAIITNEVPTATFISVFANMTNAGMIKKPPPAPIKPVKAPTITPSINIKG